MNLERVTITGADDSVRPQDLADLSVRFPFVEWGILLSADRFGKPRFPDAEWIHGLQRIAIREKMHLSLHLCGMWLRSLLLGDVYFAQWLTAGFDRVQLNFHGDDLASNGNAFMKALNSTLTGREVIFQIDGKLGKDLYLFACAHREHFTVAPLFDLSHGAGVLPKAWPKPLDVGFHGYAGGLGPDNLAEQIPLIGAAAGDTPIWIDMETKVRSQFDAKFDLALVEQCLTIARPFMNY